MQRAVAVAIGQRHVRAVLEQKAHELVGVVRGGDDQRGGAVQVVAIDLREEVGGAVDVAARSEELVEERNVAMWERGEADGLAASGEEKAGLEGERGEGDGEDLDGEGEIVVPEQRGVEKRRQTDHFAEFVALSRAKRIEGRVEHAYMSK